MPVVAVVMVVDDDRTFQDNDDDSSQATHAYYDSASGEQWEGGILSRAL